MKSLVLQKSRVSFKEYLRFTKAGLSLAVGIPGLLVYLLAVQSVSVELWTALLGIFLLALGVSALNQYQERHSDAKMPRTKNRPLVTGEISQAEAMNIIIALIATATFLLYAVLDIVGVALAFGVVVIYNAIYTPMKKISPYAVFPGAILGVIPPMITWMVAGESLLAPGFLALAWLYFIWQMPHFWLLVMIYHKDYEAAGLPTMVNVLGVESLSRITYVWILLTILSGMLVVSFFMPESHLILFAILAHSIYLLYYSRILLKSDTWKQKRTCKKIFMQLNLYTMMLVVFLVIDSWIYA